jgi:heterodisulfide reductase subunit A
MSARSVQADQLPVGAALVIGGGIAGIQASLDLVASGFYVYLAERTAAIGGVMSRLDKTFPTNDCSMCILSPKVVDCGRSPNIELLTLTELLGLRGREGDFEVELLQHPRYVDVSKCIGCGSCAAKCPKKVADDYNAGLSRRKAIYLTYPQAVPLKYAIDPAACLFLARGKCGNCAKVCPTGAIDFEQQPTSRLLRVGAIVLATGASTCDPTLYPRYGYLNSANVVTSLEFERLLSPSGPYQGRLLRPSDKTEPRKIAWIQCVGSRDVGQGRPYCSSICCMYAVKQAVVAKEHSRDGLDAALFTMDVRTYGKDFDRYYLRAREEHGVRFIRSRIVEVEEHGPSAALGVKYATEDGRLRHEDFDMVVLSVGLEPGGGLRAMARRLGIQLNRYGFCRIDRFQPVDTSRPGIYVCGTLSGPKDIPETVLQASAAAGRAAAMLAEARGTLVRREEFPEEVQPDGEPRIGVFVCHCGINIGGVVDVARVADYARLLPGVVLAETNLYTCSQDTQEKLKQAIREHALNRVVVASCTPRTHEAIFQRTLAEAGLNKYLFEMVNIREHCSWVHRGSPEAATRKAMDLMRMAVAKARLLEPLQPLRLGLSPSALIVGGGISGMVAALTLARQGLEAHLVEKADQLGGMARRISWTIENDDVQAYLRDLTFRVRNHPLIRVYAGSRISATSGRVGQFQTTVLGPGGAEHLIEHGVSVIATGASESKPEEYLYGRDSRVLTHLELEEEIAKGSARVAGCRNLVLIQCVGSRQEGRPYCSRVCCNQALKVVLKLKERQPGTNIWVLYRDMRAYGFKEEFYRMARGRGVVFIRYNMEHKPKVETVYEKDKYLLRVTATDLLLGDQFIIDADLLSLGVAMVPPTERRESSKLFKVPLSEDGFFLEAHKKLRPVEFATEGVFVCGLAHGPKLISESIAQAQAAAAKAAAVLAQGSIELEPVTSAVSLEKCDGCGLCIEVCPFQALSLVEFSRSGELRKVAEVAQSACKGCGSCQATCPKEGIYVRNFRTDQLAAMVMAALTRGQPELEEVRGYGRAVG